MINPIDGKSDGKKVKNSIVDYRYVLVESDHTLIPEQLEKYKSLQLPIAAIGYSGKRSAHAIVHVGAHNRTEYDQRVQKIFEVCKKAGLDVDVNNSDPTRLSRMPGVIRDGHPQYLMSGPMGHVDYESWEASLYVPRLPPSISYEKIMNPPPLKYPVVDGFLREEEAMLISGVPKTGKSYLMYQLALAVATGGQWIGKDCRKSSVLYIDAELSEELTLKRFKAMRERMMIPVHPVNLGIKNVKGTGAKLEDVVSDIEHGVDTADLIIIDPLYMFTTADENSNSEMKTEMELIARICATGAAVAVTHHTTKGAQGGKSSIDRAAGAGVLGRFFDTILTLNLLDRESTDKGVPQRIEGDTRSFRQPVPINLWFDGFHTVDFDGDLIVRNLINPSKVSADKKMDDNISMVNGCYHWMSENGILTDGAKFTIDDLQKAYEARYGKTLKRTTGYGYLEKAGYVKVPGVKEEFKNGKRYQHKVNYYYPDGVELPDTTLTSDTSVTSDGTSPGEAGDTDSDSSSEDTKISPSTADQDVVTTDDDSPYK